MRIKSSINDRGAKVAQFVYSKRSFFTDAKPFGFLSFILALPKTKQKASAVFLADLRAAR